MSCLSVQRLTTREFGEHAERIAAVYVQCFATEPWNEVFRPEEVIDRFREVLAFEDSILLVAMGMDDIFGATLHYPLRYNKDVSQHIALDDARTMYCEELFVSSAHHRHGIGGRLFDTATGIAMALGYERRVLRTSNDHEQAKRFYLSRGYRSIGLMQCRSRKRVGVKVRPEVDPRVILLQEVPETSIRT